VNVQERLELGQKDRPVDALLAAYAAGTLSAPMTALVTARLELKPVDRGFVAAMEAAYGIMLEEIEPVAMTGRDRNLVNIFASEDDRDQRKASHDEVVFNGHSHVNLGFVGLSYSEFNPAQRVTPPYAAQLAAGETLPPSLRQFVGCDFEDVKWRSVGHGIKQSVVTTGSTEEASLQVWPAGRHTPSHTHLGFEATLVLKGGFSDGIGEYRRGDVAVADETVEHKPIALPGEDCAVFVVREAPVKLVGTMSRFMQMLIGR
jgi:putative transcriptional regulator